MNTSLKNGFFGALFGAFVLILSAPVCAEPRLSPIPVSPTGIELAGDHAGVQKLVTALSKQSTTHVRLNAENGRLENAIGDLAPARAGQPAVAAHAFVVEQLGLNVGAGKTGTGHVLVQEKALDAFGGHHVTFRHEVAGIPVRGEEVAVAMTADNRITAVSGAYHELPATNVQATVNASDAIARATAHVGATKLRAQATAETVWVPVNNKLVLAHAVSIPAAAPLGDFEVAIDATTGAVLGTENHLSHAEDEGRATAQAKVFAHSPLDITMDKVELVNLTTNSKLSGPYVNIINADADAAVSADGTFFYDKDDTHFAEVTVYHNLSKVHKFFKSFGYTGRDKVTKATVHHGDNYDNAFYSPMTDSLAFGDGNKLNNLALEDNVAFHEFGHAVNRTIGSMGGSEGGAMNEAYSDYFACSMNNNPLMGVWVMKKLNKPFMRNMENNRHYPEDIQGQVHRDGEIWGGVCWDVRKAFGAPTTDKLLFKSLYFLGSRPTFAKGLESVIAADKELFNGSHVAQITEIFAKRGIKAGSNQPELAGFRALKRQASFLSLIGGAE